MICFISFRIQGTFHKQFHSYKLQGTYILQDI